MSVPLKVYIIAGEPSGDKLGGALMAGLKTLKPVEFQGIGGPLMQAQGLRSLFDMADLSVMGLLEVLPRVPKLLKRVKQTVAAVVAAKPDVLITIDSPDFCLRVAGKVRDVLPDLKVAHYVAPSVWAWRPERAEKMARHVDHVLALLPFEPPLMQAAGMSCDFVGHPVVAEPQPEAAALLAMAQELDFQPDKERLICLLPGSRKGEIRRLLPLFQTVSTNLQDDLPALRFVLPMSGAVAADVRHQTAHWQKPPLLLDPAGFTPEQAEARKRAVFGLSHAALATSGTVALELAAAECPMVVAYKANYLTTRMVKKLAQIDTANLINIVTDSRVVPEFLFENCTVGKITPAMHSLIQAPEGQRAACRKTMQALGAGGENPGLRAARSVLDFLG